ncbi:histidine phosphatase family protein [Bacillus sp. SCS-153A]|uniref:histidine phosphatase family protein n=1 Tax=Rossellomorea sedimentorum TaxID=3115294 RepID=UPI003906A0E5
MEILLIRHGESEADILEVHEGRADFSLTERGRKQVKNITERVKNDFPPEFIWCSPLKRARETGEALARAVNCPIQFGEDLMEHNNGIQAGVPFKEAESIKMPVHPHERIEQGESALEFRLRIEMAFSKIVAESKFERIAIAAHGGVITNLLRAFLKLPVDHSSWFLTGDTGIHLLEVRENSRVIHFMNDTSHLK